jgi:uncharacterized protein (TIGR02145 family)
MCSYGLIWSSTDPTPTAGEYSQDSGDHYGMHTEGTGVQSFTCTVTDLLPGTTYYIRAWACGHGEYGYGEVLNFSTGGTLGSVADIDGNVYQTVIIGSQEWMMENLKVAHYRNGNPIPNITDSLAWGKLSYGACCYCDNDQSNAEIYGLLYNWLAVHDARSLAPEGWRIPTSADWQLLIRYLGGTDVAGGLLKESGLDHWLPPNTGATNAYAFAALPGGSRSYEGGFNSVGHWGNFWTSTEYNPSSSWGVSVWSYGENAVLSGEYRDKRSGYSVRCVKN